MLALVGFLALVAQTAWAQSVTRTTLVDKLLLIYPGAAAGDCWDLAPGYLRITADSPPGRTGEAAYLELTKTVDGADVSLLRTLVTQGQPDPVYNVGDRDSVEVRFTLTGGHYCYGVSVTKTLDDPLPADRPERPTKQVHVVITHRTNP